MFKRVRLLAYLFAFTSACITMYPLYAAMFIERSGLSTGDISVLFFIWTFAALVFEVPTGVFADRFSRRWSLVGSAALQGACFAIWLLAPNFWGYALGFVVWALSWALQSGAAQAYLYDELEQLGRADQYTKIFNRTQSMSFAGMVVAYGVAYLIGAREYDLLLLTSIAMCVIAAGFAIALPKERPHRHKEVDLDVGSLREAWRAIRYSKQLLAITASIAALTGLVGAIEEYVPIYYRLVGLDTEYMPLALLAGLLLTSLLTWFAHHLEHTLGITIAFAIVAAALVLLVTSIGSMVIAIGGMFIFMRVVQIASTLFQASLQHGFDGRSRATLGSLPVLLGYFVTLAVVTIWGVVATAADDYAAVRATALFVIVVTLGFGALWGRRRLVEKPATC